MSLSRHSTKQIPFGNDKGKVVADPFGLSFPKGICFLLRPSRSVVVKTFFYSILRLVCRVGLFIGPCLLLVALGFVIYTFAFLRQGVSSVGKVVSLTARPGEDNTENYFPVFTFVAANGQKYVVSSDAGSNPSEFTVGQNVSVKYKLADPGNAKILSYWQLWTTPTALCVLGLVFGGLGFGFFIYERRSGRRGLSIASSQ